MATPIKSLFPPIEKKPFLVNKQKKREPSPDVVYRQNGDSTGLRDWSKLSSSLGFSLNHSLHYVQIEKLSSSLGSNYKSNPSRTYKTFLRRFHHLWDRFTNQISTIQVWLPLEFFINPEAHCWNHFHVFHKNVEITFMYFTDGSVHKTIAEITFMYFTKKKNQCWNHFHVFHKTIVEITFMYFTKPLLKSLSCISQH